MTEMIPNHNKDFFFAIQKHRNDQVVSEKNKRVYTTKFVITFRIKLW